jgi:hypothetical protein
VARFRLEEDLPIPGHGVLSTRLGADDLEELVETARLWALKAHSHKQLRLYDRSVELLAVEGQETSLVLAIDEWDINRPPLCECGETLHSAQIAGRPGWYCMSCSYRAQAA